MHLAPIVVVFTFATVSLPLLAYAQSTNVQDYVLLAERQLKTKKLRVDGGNLGVNSPGGRFLSRGDLDAPGSVVAADDVRIKSKNPECAALLANTASGDGADCGPPTPFTAPFPDAATACGFPADLPTSCDPSLPPVLITLGQTVNLPPGTYGIVEVQGGSKGNGRLELSGLYTFCSLKIESKASVVPVGPTELRIIDKLDVNKASALNPSGGPDPEALTVFVGGDSNFGKDTTARAILCAPNGKLSVESGTTVEGRFVANTIGFKGNTVGGRPAGTTTSTVPPTSSTSSTTSSSTTTSTSTSVPTTSSSSSTSTSTTSSSSTSLESTTTTVESTTTTLEPTTTTLATTTTTLEPTTTTLATTTTTLEPTTTSTTSSTTTSTSTSSTLPLCGNGVVDPGEVCDGDEPCDPSSPGGAMIICADDCLSLDDSACPATTTTSLVTSTTLASTTTSTSSSTTTPSTSTTSTTLSECGNGVVEPGELCDGDVPCNPSSPDGAFAICSDDCQSLDESACENGVAEICGNCIDDNDNNLVDFEDPECCAGLQSLAANVTRAAIKPTKTPDKSFLKLRSRLASAGTLEVDPSVDDVFLQIRESPGGEVLCAWAPNDLFMRMKHGRVFKYWGVVESAQGIEDMRVTLRKNGQVRYRAFGKRVNFGVPGNPQLQVTVGFRNAEAGDATNRCAAAVEAFQTTGGGALVIR